MNTDNSIVGAPAFLLFTALAYAAAGDGVVLDTGTNAGTSPDFGLLMVQKEEATEALRQQFQALADRWSEETKYLSSLAEAFLHPAYQRIIGMGQPALPFIFGRFHAVSEDWLWALQSITGENPAEQAASFEEATAAWLRWGQQRGHVSIP